MSFSEALPCFAKAACQTEAGGAKPGRWVARPAYSNQAVWTVAYDFANERAYDFAPAGRVLWHI
ncbi:hypothetical protein ACVILL_007670 [Bradyrhizobium sp. USDA 3364]